MPTVSCARNSRRDTVIGHALEVLEFERVLERVARRASSDAGKARILALRPMDDTESVSRELARVSATMRFVDAAPSWGLASIADVGPELAQLAAEGAVLDPMGIHRFGSLLRSSRLLASELAAHPGGYPELDTVAGRLIDRRELETAIERCVDEEGKVLDSASPDLKRIRSRLRGAHARIVKQLEKYLRSLSDRFVVPDGSVTIRDGRYVIPVRREGKGEVGGIVHDESQTGATLFIEPPVAIEAMNQLRDLEREEVREIRRVLEQMTARIAPDRDEIAGAFDALVDFDALHARARTAISWTAAPPRIVSGDPSGMRLLQARHPLLVEAGETEVVPYDLDLEAHERCMVVSGPNTGGKSVFLKATGLIAALAQSGIVPPVGKGTVLPVFGSFYADIGDEQSISQSLSTFSAHLANLSDVVVRADARSLILIDEMGTGTDPAEGAALSRAVLEALVERGATTIASSHLGELKQLDAEGSGIVNASLQFDSERMEPTYRLMKGRPGRSYGLAIARRLGFPPRVLDRAEAFREAGAARMEDVLARLEQQEREVARLVGELADARSQTDLLRTDVERREVAVKEAELAAEGRARSDARKLLMEARAEVESAISEMRGAIETGRTVDDAAREARRRVERAAGQQREARAALGSGHGGDGVLSSGATARAGVLEEGDTVRIRSTGARGRLVEVRGHRGFVEAGALRFEIPLDDLEKIDALVAPNRRSGGWSGPAKGQARLEVDLRGMRVDEVGIELDRALDEAVLEDLEQLRIIHGKGTGALRQRVGEILTGDGRVREHRMGGPTEGGAGVTVAVFRG
jgi:DNA mismatch repair protein MutS2